MSLLHYHTRDTVNSINQEHDMNRKVRKSINIWYHSTIWPPDGVYFSITTPKVVITHKSAETFGAYRYSNHIKKRIDTVTLYHKGGPFSWR